MKRPDPVQRFQFDRDFDAEVEQEHGAVAAARSQKSRPAITPSEIAALREEAFAAGRAEGVAVATAETEARLQAGIEAATAETLAAILPEILALRAARAAHHLQLEQDLLALVHGLAEQVLPEVFTALAPRRIEAFCRQALRMAEGQAGLELRVAPDIHEAVVAALKAATTASGAPLRLTADPALQPGEAKALWDQGRAELAQTPLHQSLISTLAQLAKPAIPDRS